jgi:hypothetical protein
MNSRHPHILHIFDHACNLINEHREVVSIVTPEISNGPFNLVVEEDICFSQYLRLESEVSTSPAQLDLGDLTVHTANASLWNPYPDWEKLHAGKGEIGHQLSQILLTNHRMPGIDAAQSDLAAANFQFLISTFFSSLVAADVLSSLIAAQKLAGLGVGLTPAGDDFLMGAIYAAWIIHPPAVASGLAQKIADTAAPLTTSLSAAWLRSAGRGEAGVLWHEFFDALLSSDRLQIEQERRNILAVGETSGADALAGFTGVFSFLTEKKGSSHG